MLLYFCSIVSLLLVEGSKTDSRDVDHAQEMNKSLLGNLSYSANTKESFWINKLALLSKANWEMQKHLRNRQIFNKYDPIPNPPEEIGPENPVKILFWEKTYVHDIFYSPDYGLEECPTPCSFTFNQEEAKSSHVIVTQIMDDTVLDVYAGLKPWQKRALMNMWPHKLAFNPIPIMSLRHMLISYSRYADVQLDFSHHFELPPLVPTHALKKDRGFMAVFLNDFNDYEDSHFRTIYLNALSRLIKIDFYGELMHSQGLPLIKDPTEVAKIRQNYHFTIVAEPIPYDDYVTDAIYKALATDCVPVYFGAPNINEFLPDPENPKIIIDVRHYYNPVELVKKLRSLLNNPDQYMEYFNWRKKTYEGLKESDDLDGVDGVSMVYRAKSMMNTSNSFRKKGSLSVACRICQEYERRTLIGKG